MHENCSKNTPKTYSSAISVYRPLWMQFIGGEYTTLMGTGLPWPPSEHIFVLCVVHTDILFSAFDTARIALSQFPTGHKHRATDSKLWILKHAFFKYIIHVCTCESGSKILVPWGMWYVIHSADDISLLERRG
jgi:hypothetical protein